MNNASKWGSSASLTMESGGALACERCSHHKAGCLHVGLSVSAAPSTNVAGWHAVVREGAALVVDVMDRQTEVLGELASKVHGLRRIVERLSSSSASSLQGTASGGDTGQESTWDEDEEVREDEGMKEDKEMWMDDERVELQVCREGEESSDTEEEDKGGKHDEERERDGDDEEEDGDEEGADDEGGTEPEVSTTPWRPRVLHPRMKAWKGKGKATKKGKGKGKGKMYQGVR